jgi:hypothetical protein
VPGGIRARGPAWTVWSGCFVLACAGCFDFDGYTRTAQGGQAGRQVSCGESSCSVMCCPYEGQYGWTGDCVASWDECCPTPGQVCFGLECDGPEDCPGGQICCEILASRGASTSCMTPGDCAYFIPVCHSHADCGGGRTCSGSGFTPFFATCQ